MKNKVSATVWNIRMMTVVLALGIVGTINSVQAQQKAGTDGINDAPEQKAVLKRDPFWPVGYVPKNITNVIPKETPKSSTATVENSWDEAMKAVVINGVSHGEDNTYLAIINGKIKSVGDTVTINQGGTLYTWAVNSIEPPGSVKLRRISAR